MSIFTDTQISAWAQAYEREITAEHDFIVDRISLDIVAGIGEYEIPNYVTNIRSVLYQGKELHAKGFRASNITGDVPGVTSGAIPFEYVFSGKGLRVLKFYPTPNLSIPIYTSSLWTAAADFAAVIVEFYRTSVRDDVTRQLPEWLRRYILKDYVAWKAFGMDGKQQDLRAADYYSKKLESQKTYLQMIKTNMFRASTDAVSVHKMPNRQRPGRPVLPSNFGYPLSR